MYDKNSIDTEAEREAVALSKQGKTEKPRYIKHQKDEYNKIAFDKLFKD